MTDIEPFGWGGSGMVSTARDLARFLQALLGGELLPQAMMVEMLSTVTVASDWEESDGYGLGIEDVTSIGDAASPCGAAWGHFGFSTGYTTIPLASKSGDRRVVVMFNTHPMSEEMWSAAGRLRGPATAPRPLVSAHSLKSLDDHLEAIVRAGVPGVVVVAAGPELSWERAAGVADAASGAPMTTEHRFLIGSVTKTFVAAVVLQLVGEGALALDEEVGPVAEGVTLRQLLNHTSGLPDYYADFDSLIAPYRADRGYKPNLTPRAALELVHARPRLFPPGVGWEYSGGNYLALGLLVEEATGTTLREELKRRIAEPLGLEAPICETRAGLARAYLQPGNPVFPDAARDSTT